YRAEQDNPRRLVALKLMRAGFSSPSSLRRFRREAELLGRLQHPGVAHVIEAGTTGEAGGRQPYFAMELIDGRPLMEHVRHHGLSVRARVELMVRICDAVEHAHLSGIVHRDLKPANILVTEGETTASQAGRDRVLVGQPKILDFGVARLLDADRLHATMQTNAGELIGTLPYMSPEQLGSDPNAVDMRCDVYALGVLLFEMLTGRRPHDLAGRSLAEAARIICDEPPTALRAVDRRLRGDLDTIVTAATARDADRRYGSVGLLAGDLRRYLADEPILARPPTTVYQLRKFARRNRGLVAGLAAALVVLVGGLVASAALYARAEGRAELMRRALYAQRITLAQHALESGDAREVATLLDACPDDLRHWEWQRLRTMSDRSERTLAGHAAIVNDVAFTPDGRFVLTAGGYDENTPRDRRERSVRLWNTETGAMRIVVADQVNQTRSIAVSPDGRSFVTITRTLSRLGEPAAGWLRRWNLADGTMIAELPVHPERTGGLAFTPDGSAVFVGGALGRAALVDVASWTVRWAEGTPHFARRVAVTSDGRFGVCSEWNGDVRLWDLRTGEPRWGWSPHGDLALWSIAVSPDDATIATANRDRTVKLLDLATGAVRRTLPDAGAVVTAVTFSPDGRVVSGAEDGVIRVYDPTTGKQLATLLGHAHAVTGLTFAPGAALLASASADGTARLWRLPTPAVDVVRTPHGQNEVNRGAWHPGGTRLVTAGDDGRACVVDARTGDVLMTLDHGHRYVHAADWSPDGTRIASLESGGTMHLWDAVTGASQAAWPAHDVRALATKFSPDGRMIASCGRGQLRLWDGASGALIRAIDPAGSEIVGIAWHPDGRVLASAHRDGEVRLWNAVDGTRRGGLPTDVPLGSVCFHPKGRWLAVGDSTGVVRLFDWARGREERALPLHAGACNAISFSPDGERMVTGGDDGWLRLTTRAGDPVMTLKAHRAGVMAATFSPDGARIASTSRDFSLRIWSTGVDPRPVPGD
ncbi:MAG: protein kinase, partial [Phycisphaerales bacterium]|nr:protein kinase [Phycisphaerales bacterium]